MSLQTFDFVYKIVYICSLSLFLEKLCKTNFVPDFDFGLVNPSIRDKWKYFVFHICINSIGIFKWHRLISCFTLVRYRSSFFINFNLSATVLLRLKNCDFPVSQIISIYNAAYVGIFHVDKYLYNLPSQIRCQFAVFLSHISFQGRLKLAGINQLNFSFSSLSFFTGQNPNICCQLCVVKHVFGQCDNCFNEIIFK